MIIYHAECTFTRPEPVECDVPGYPNRDANGEQMFENTHFATEGEAWEKLVEGHRLHQEAMAHYVREARERLAKTEQQLVQAALDREECDRNFFEWCTASKGDK